MGTQTGRNPERICTANKTNGEPCGNYAIVGHRICRFHGGSAPQVKKVAAEVVAAAKDRMATVLVPLSVQRLEKIIRNAKTSDADSIRAALAVLDRVGLVAGTSIDLNTTVRQMPPAEILEAALTGMHERMVAGGVVRGELVTPEVPFQVAEEGPDATVLTFRPDFI